MIFTIPLLTRISSLRDILLIPFLSEVDILTSSRSNKDLEITTPGHSTNTSSGTSCHWSPFCMKLFPKPFFLPSSQEQGLNLFYFG